MMTHGFSFGKKQSKYLLVLALALTPLALLLALLAQFFVTFIAMKIFPL